MDVYARNHRQPEFQSILGYVYDTVEHVISESEKYDKEGMEIM